MELRIKTVEAILTRPAQTWSSIALSGCRTNSSVKSPSPPRQHIGHLHYISPLSLHVLENLLIRDLNNSGVKILGLQRSDVRPLEDSVRGPGLLGNNFLYVLEMARRNVMQPGVTVIPCRAVMYAMGIEALTTAAQGFDFSCLNKYRCRFFSLLSPFLLSVYFPLHSISSSHGMASKRTGPYQMAGQDWTITTQHSEPLRFMP